MAELLAAPISGTFPRARTSRFLPPVVSDLIGIRERKYLDATGLVHGNLFVFHSKSEHLRRLLFVLELAVSALVFLAILNGYQFSSANADLDHAGESKRRG